MKYLIAFMLLTFSVFARAEFFLGLELGSDYKEYSDKIDSQGIATYTNIKDFKYPLWLTTLPYQENLDENYIKKTGYLDFVLTCRNKENRKSFFKNTVNVISSPLVKSEDKPLIKGTSVYFKKKYDEIIKSKVLYQCNEILTEDDLNKLFVYYPRQHIEFKDYFDRFDKELKKTPIKKKIHLFLENNTNNLYVLITKTYKLTPRLYQIIKHLNLGSIKDVSYTLFGYSPNFVKVQQKAIQDLQKN